ncbi:hypothetical protein MTR_0005s0220 [Medicago truncatula]|uniref:Uncharacterized protein n=1 Tax=Medicago truncatula TaxID=3880 RepID=A0A072TJK8_MEDTR|nr:hypothetical protein MTR_0005s0220 [Medicago truncatula]
MIDRLYLHGTKEICMLPYEKYMLSLKIGYLDRKISRLKERCGRYEMDQPDSNCEGKKEVINIDYNTQLQNILDDFLMANQVSFEKFDVQCGDLVAKAHESQRKLVQMEIECHKVVVEENLKVRSVDIFPKSESNGVKKITRVQMDTYSSILWENYNSKSLTMGAWEHLLLCYKFMEFLPNRRKKKGDIFLLSYLPP